MYTVELTMRAIDEQLPEFVHRSEFHSWEEAHSHALSDACMRGTIKVTIENQEGVTVAAYSRLDNFWIEYKDDNGNFVSEKEFFESRRQRTINSARAQGLNIDIAPLPNGLYKVTAGKHTVYLTPPMLNWIDDICFDVTIDDIEDNNENVQTDETSDEWFDDFAKRLQQKVERAFEFNPDVDTRLRDHLS